MMLVFVLAAGLAGATAPAAPAEPQGDGTAPTQLAPSRDLDAFIGEAKVWVLHGKRLPSDYRLRLARMTPEDRIQALIFLRRAGLLNGETWGVQDLLARDIDQKDDH